MIPLFRVHLTLVQQINLIEKCGLPGFDRKLRRNMVPQYNCLNFIEQKDTFGPLFLSKNFDSYRNSWQITGICSHQENLCFELKISLQMKLGKKFLRHFFKTDTFIVVHIFSIYLIPI